MYTPITILSLALGLAAAAPTNIYSAKANFTVPSVTAASTPASSPQPGPSAACSPKASAKDLALFEKLTSAPNANIRQSYLSDADYVFDFKNKCDTEGFIASGKGGEVVRADRASMPALVGQGGAVAIGFLGPCGFNTPHVHPRAAELNLVVEGSLFASVTAENGARHMSHTLTQWQMTVFPAGAMHTEFNPDCTPSTFVASFPHEDPGVGQIAQEFFGLENEIVKGSAGGELSIEGADIDKFRKLVPANVAAGVDSCLIKCGISKR
ncbi:hypothetical protein WAI453_003837 [Rhynchosporium graminicola]|uniref:Related to spherulin 1A n=1 Tax=Rhynchosporium graminicola TaxID=2792576 RepID=A0A1E1JYS3_9HELO|nr:related to spherulin 1A precursor [Rhynchosporium commune]